MMYTLALWIGYFVATAISVAVLLGGLLWLASMWEWHVMLRNYKFDGKGNLVKTDGGANP